MAEEVGTIECPMCKTVGTVKREARAARCLYWSCMCGTIQPRLPAGQAFVKANAKLFDAPESELEAAPAPDTPEPKPAAKRRGMWETFWSDDDD